MSNSAFTLVHRPGRVFETSDFGQHWVFGQHRVQGSYEEGLRVKPDSVAFNLALAEFTCVLPWLSPDAPGRYPVFTVAAGEPCEPDCTDPDCTDPDRDPDFWCPSSASGGVLLRVIYEPSKALFHFGMNAGTRSRDLQWVSLGPALPEAYTGRVLRASVLIAPTGLYPSIEDAVSEQEELFGELTLASSSQSSRLPPWGAAPTGNWWAMSGAEDKHDKEEKSFPAGFGLSDVRITLIDMSDDIFDTVPYSGELDHLVRDTRDPFSQDDWGLDFDDEESISQLLQGLAEQLHIMSGDAGTWARRAEGLAEETQELVLRLPEDGLPEDGLPEDGLPEDGLPEDGLLEDRETEEAGEPYASKY